MLVSLTAAYGVLAQAPSATRAQPISGRVIDARDSAPLRRARVVVSSGERQIETMFTDDQGRFTIVNAPVTPLTVRASKAGFANAVVAVAAGATGSDIGFALARSAGVNGRVRDENGTPVSSAYVTGRLLLPGAGRRPDPSGRFFVQTDRLGDYRLGSLPAGRYEITAVSIPPELRGRKEEQLFGPADALDVATGAVTVTLAGGDEARDVDFTIPGIAQTCLSGPGVRPPDGAAAAAISGRVIGSSGEPLVCATVHVGPDAPVSQVYTDRQGRYQIDGLPAGSFFLQARQNGYLSLHYGQRQPADLETPIALREGERRGGADIVLPRESFVTGIVVDEHGEPMEGIPVAVAQIRRVDGRLAAMIAPGAAFPRPTDDRGQYRIVGVLPGTYLVTTMPTRGIIPATLDNARSYAPIYSPGTPDAAMAQRIVVGAGRDVQGIDILYTPTVTSTVSGTAVDATGRPLAGTASMNVSGRSGAVSVDSWSVALGAGGAFVFRNVPRGDYVVRVSGPVGANQFGMQYVTVADVDPPPVRITLTVGATLQGRVVVEGPPDLNTTGLNVSIMPADVDYTPPRRLAMFARADDGTFRATGAVGPSRIAIGATPACEGCYLKSAYVNGTDAADRPLDFGLKGGTYRDIEIVVSDAGAAIEGRVTDGRGTAVRVYSVVVVPTDPGLWYPESRHVKAASAGPDGAYRLTGLPPGDYFVAAVSRLQMGSLELTDSELLEQVAARGRRVTLGERERRMLELTMIRR